MHDTYDYLIIGTGMAALTVGALLANAGHRVKMLEAHSAPGGYAHTFDLNGFEFSAQVHYIWGCAPGQSIYQFLKALDLHNDVEFSPFNPEGYDRVGLPDGNQVAIPYGFEQLIKNIEALYPEQGAGLKEFLSIITAISNEVRRLPNSLHWWHYLSHGLRSRTALKYKNKTLQQVFDKCGVTREAQAILCAQAGDFGSPPEELSVIAYTALFCGYNEGAYYPTRHFKYFIERIAQFICDHEGCDIEYNAKVIDIHVKGSRVTEVITEHGNRYTADTIICNIDPQKASKIIGRQRFTKKSLSALSYDYSPSSFISYVGLEGIDLRDYGFGACNIWHLEQWDMNQMWKEQMQGNFEQPWLFISSPALRTSDTTSTPEGCQNLEFGTLAPYGYFHDLLHSNPEAYKAEKQRIQDHFLDIIEARYVPNLRQHIKVIATGTPLTNETFCGAPYGTCYGSRVTPQNIGLSRLNAKTPWKNFYWCNASSGYAGIHGTILTGVYLYNDLTRDKLLGDFSAMPSTEDAIAYATSRYQQDID